MAISVKCPKCGKGYGVDEKAAGRQVKCRQCNTVFTAAALAPGAADDEDPFVAMNALADFERPGGAAPPPVPARHARGAPMPVQPGHAQPAPRVAYASPGQRKPAAPFLSDSAAQNLSLVLVLAFLGGSIGSSTACCSRSRSGRCFPRGSWAARTA
jgi:predicted Zn finger-like uncharacterized protein